MHKVSTKLSMSRSQLRVHMCQPRKSDRQEWQSLVVLNGIKIFLNGTNISFLKFICGILNRGVANSFWNHVIQISSGQMYFQDIYSNLWKVKVFIGNIFSLKSNTYFWGVVMFVQDGFLYLIVTKHKLTVQWSLLTQVSSWNVAVFSSWESAKWLCPSHRGPFYIGLSPCDIQASNDIMTLETAAVAPYFRLLVLDEIMK